MGYNEYRDIHFKGSNFNINFFMKKIIILISM